MVLVDGELLYLYLGGDTVVRTRDIIGVFDLDNTSTSHLTRKYLASAQKAGRIVEVTGELPKSFVVCAGDLNEYSVYLSQMSPATLRGRYEANDLGK